MVLFLSGCASGGVTPLGDALTGWATSDSSVAERAASLEYASLSLDTGDRKGLVALGAVAGPATYWPTGNNGMLVLYHDGLQATAGLQQDLLETRYRSLDGAAGGASDFVPWQQDTPGNFRMERHWQGSDGLPNRLAARGSLTCGESQPRQLPLGERQLQRCDMQLVWEDGQRTRSTLWRDAETLRLWAADTTPWPGGPRIRWEVARGW
ncbi:YjbF family lipoprotein [Halomonas sp. ATCH28]|uniref:YjbF family lipoprotein n=1 Tax=Halomonas gemina TaxID=2945105 RepID=A0ABT0SY26_9GAMM|nr:YjbF family lipoprotein [Halomonas gemina]MCL7939473.1 YjbF family lipoprotein [Halomonas gemina]